VETGLSPRTAMRFASLRGRVPGSLAPVPIFHARISNRSMPATQTTSEVPDDAVGERSSGKRTRPTSPTPTPKMGKAQSE
jgi:hypothetical protein